MATKKNLVFPVICLKFRIANVVHDVYLEMIGSSFQMTFYDRKCLFERVTLSPTAPVTLTAGTVHVAPPSLEISNLTVTEVKPGANKL